MTEQNEALVQQNDVEKVLVKLNSIKEDNLTTRQKQEINRIGEIFARHFDDLSWRLLGISDNDVKKFDKNETRVIADLIAQKAKPRARFQIISSVISFSSPLLGLAACIFSSILPSPAAAVLMVAFGWIPGVAILGNAESWHYLHCRKILKEAYGEKYFPRNYLEHKNRN